MTYESVLIAAPWVVLAGLVVTAIAKVVIVRMALRGADPRDRPGIIRSCAELFRVHWWPWRRGPRT